jgi:hypothetical protein
MVCSLLRMLSFETSEWHFDPVDGLSFGRDQQGQIILVQSSAVDLGLSSRARHRGIFVPFNPEINTRHPRINLVAGEGASRRARMDICFPPARLSLASPANVNFIEPEYPRSESTIEEGTSA